MRRLSEPSRGNNDGPEPLTVYAVHKCRMVDLRGGLTISLRRTTHACGADHKHLRAAKTLIQPEILMTTFDEREKAFEKKFALDQDLKFRAESRRNKMVAEWAAVKLGITGPDVEDYIKAVRRADLQSKGDEDVFQKLRGDFDAKGISITDTEIREAMFKFLEEAVNQVQKEAK